MSALLEIDSVTKSFSIPSVRRSTVREHLFGALRPRRIEKLGVLKDVSFEVRAGETLGIMGRNGCGKSTLLKIICGIFPPDSGSVSVRAGLTPILELGFAWNHELDAVDNIFLIGSVMGLSLREIRSRMDSILSFAEVERFANLQLKHYSSGMSARLAYSIAFHAVREILILDEIFAVGDAAFRAKCEEKQRELHEAGHTIVLVTHDAETVGQFCDRAILLEEGSILFEGPGQEVASEYLSLMATPR